MPEIRHDPLRGYWVILAPERADRPQPTGTPHKLSGDREHECPFCPGHENETPSEVYAVREQGSAANSPAWQLRVVPNLYPAVRPEAALPEPHAAHPAGNLLPAAGHHEVVVETPKHDARFHEYSDEEATRVFLAYRERLLAYRAENGTRYGMFFKNHGAAAGASLAHPHSQLISLPLVPPGVARQLEFTRSHAAGDRSYFAECIEQAEQAGRVVCEVEGVVALCPYASRFPFEVMLLPRKQVAKYEESGEKLLAAAALCTRQVTAALAAALAEPAYNWLLANSPFDTSPHDRYHWSIEIFPRLVGIAGFEWGTGCYVNTVAPEQAAEQLRKRLCHSE